MASVEYINATCVYPGAVSPSVDELNLTIDDGEFMVLVGPSGSGKSTALRMLAGLEDVTSGQVLIDGNDVSRRAPKERDIAMLEERRAIVSVNVGAAALPGLALLAAAHPGCTFLVAHLGDPGRHAAVPSRALAERNLAPLLALADLEHVHVKISGLYAVSDPPHAYPHLPASPFVDVILATFGPARCLWGSDFSPSLDFVSFDQALHPIQLDVLAPDDRARVMGANLLHLLHR